MKGPNLRTILLAWAFVWVVAGLSSVPSVALAKNGLGGTISASNNFYIVWVQDLRGSGVGLYTVTTGPLHPAGPGLNVLFGGGNPSTSFNTIRSYSSGTDYVQGTATKTSPNAVVVLDPFGTSVPFGTTGVRTTYVLPGPGAISNSTPDRLTIVQDVNVNGTNFVDSTVEVTTTVINDGTATVQIGVRYLWDYQVGLDDGPTFKINSALCPALTTEAQFSKPVFDSYRIEDNDMNPSPPTFDIFGTVNGPSTVVPPPTDPDLLEFVCWPNASGTAFNYAVNPNLSVSVAGGACSGAGGGDSAVLYFFGHDQANALSIPPGGQITVSASLFLTPPQPPPPPSPCATRTARFWFTHAENTNDPNCVTLLRAIQANCAGGMNVGFLGLPTLPRYGNVIDPQEIAMMESLGFYFKNQGQTGESGGAQSSHLSGSALCRARKQLSVEIIAATANSALLGTDPSTCSYFNGVTVTNFPPNLLDQARAAASGLDPAQDAVMTALLRKFNSAGITAGFPDGLTECSPGKTSALRKLSRDPTTQVGCPGVNNNCTTAESIVFPTTSNPFTPAKFSRSLSLGSGFTGVFTNPTACGTGGPAALWKINADVGTSNRQFTADTFGSNFQTLLQIWSGTCSNLVSVTCSTNAAMTLQSQVSFVTDGSNTFFIVAEGANGASGRLKFHVTSP